VFHKPYHLIHIFSSCSRQNHCSVLTKPQLQNHCSVSQTISCNTHISTIVLSRCLAPLWLHCLKQFPRSYCQKETHTCSKNLLMGHATTSLASAAPRFLIVAHPQSGARHFESALCSNGKWLCFNIGYFLEHGCPHHNQVTRTWNKSEITTIRTLKFVHSKWWDALIIAQENLTNTASNGSSFVFQISSKAYTKNYAIQLIPGAQDGIMTQTWKCALPNYGEGARGTALASTKDQWRKPLIQSINKH
jgi:hypothetical protein